MYQLPLCIKEKAPQLLVLHLTQLTINSLAGLPSTLTSLTTYYSRMVGTAAGAVDGFGEAGAIAWDEIWSLFPNLIVASFNTPTISSSTTLPSKLLSTIATFLITNSELTGSIPENFLADLTSTMIDINLASNKIAGALPATLFSRLPSITGLTSVKFLATDNNIEGEIPSGFLRPGSAQTFYIYLGDNKLSGSLPEALFTSAPSLFDFRFVVSRNLLNGSLPTSFFNAGATVPASPQFLSLEFHENNLTGAIPPSFLMRGLTQNATFATLQLLLQGNRLTGSIPETLFYATPDSKRESLSEGRDFNAAPIVSIGGTYSTIEISNNLLTGSINPSLMEVLRPNDGAAGYIYFYAASNKLTGPLPSVCSPTKIFVLQVNGNDLNGTIPNEWQSCRMARIRIQGNTKLTGTIPPQLLSLPDMLEFDATSTNLTGGLPALRNGSSYSFGFTQLEFCTASSVSSISTFDGSCDLRDTLACNCRSSYTPVCTTTACATPSPILIAPPVTTPAPIACSGTAPSTSFLCQGGVWTADVVTSDTLVVQPNSGTVVVTGNVTSSSIIVNGLGTTIEIFGCASNLSEIHIELTQEQLKEIGNSKLYQLLSTLSSNCSSALDDVSVSASVADAGCRKMKVAKVTSSDQTTLSGLFTVDSSACNTWWIILVSVICGVILLILITFILLAIFWKPFRMKFRPYSSTREVRGNV